MNTTELIKKYSLNMRHLADRLGMNGRTFRQKAAGGKYHFTYDEELKLRSVIKNQAEALLEDLKR